MTPCILPWINFSTNTFGRARACGYSDTKSDAKLRDSSIPEQWNGDYFKTIRSDFMQGKWPDNCRRCRYVESLDGISKRMEENGWFYEDNRHLIDQTAPDGTVPYQPPHMDIRVGTICNLKCIHCGTGASSKWQEDKSLLGKYPNTENYRIDNKWIEQDSLIWDSMRTGIAHTRKMNFLGGEPFANKQHNRFVREIAETGHAAHITLSYVTNGLLIDDAMVQTLLKFKNVIMRVSIDAAGLPGEYFRYPMRWARFVSQLEMLSRYARDNDNIDLGLQWTCSNISMFYLVDTHVEMRKLFPELRLLLCNHVEWPQHMSAQVLPQDIKRGIAAQISAHDWGNDATAVSFYVNHMLAEDMWLDHGHVLLNYLDDLDRARSTDWHSSFADMRLEDHDRR